MAKGDVVDSASNGFTVKITLELAAPAADVYRTIVDRVGMWWAPDHTWSGNSANLSIDPRPGGCWCEKLPGGGAQHMTVVFADPGKLLRLRGALGPLQSMAVDGSMTFQLAEAGGKTRLQLTYVVGGYLPGAGGGEPLGKAVDAVLTAQVQRLKKLVETGRPE
jgi:uncharacterized protein YndB with AHSA1/START domain